ncbi:MAG: hypothetical protein HY537_06515 [Deltaproteobacteria bacterium]|nr:hypothetical protein [Deltaproteobacteria bacterium]
MKLNLILSPFITYAQGWGFVENDAEEREAFARQIRMVPTSMSDKKSLLQHYHPLFEKTIRRVDRFYGK